MASSWIATLEEEARRVLPPVYLDYFRQGARDGLVAVEAVEAWRRFRLVPRTLVDVGTLDRGAVLLGEQYAAPLGAAPSTLQRAADPDGEVAMASGCAAARVPMVLSSNASATFAEIAGTGARWWLQAYLTQDRDRSRTFLEAAAGAGAGAVVLTVDTPVVGTKYDGDHGPVWPHVPPGWLRSNLGAVADDPKATDLGPADIAWLGAVTGLPVVVKGVLHPQDAVRAVEAGAAAVWVSNHGGRQFARAVPTSAVIGEIAQALAGTAELYVDGGVRTGTDVLTALALGADAVFLGRLPLFALAVDGRHGVERLFADLIEELDEAMRLVGAPDLDDVRRLVVHPG